MKVSCTVLKGSKISNYFIHPTEERLEIQAIADDITSVRFVPGRSY